MAWRFTKMHGAGNDFVVLDCRENSALPSTEIVQKMGDRHFGIGFDQLLLIEPAKSSSAIASYRIMNQDASFAEQCGNGARCIAHWLVLRGVARSERFCLDSPAGLIEVQHENLLYTLNMGTPNFSPDKIPLRTAFAENNTFEFSGKSFAFSAVSMGNPHAVFVVENIEDAIEPLALALQASEIFPLGVNVGFVQIQNRQSIRLRVFERGVGETLACGSGACAAAVSLIRQGLLERRVAVHLPGGTLTIDWQTDAAPIFMSGPAEWVYEGEYCA